jgi:hypothetical protein
MGACYYSPCDQDCCCPLTLIKDPTEQAMRTEPLSRKLSQLAMLGILVEPQS